jgi:hypothetical protein
MNAHDRRLATLVTLVVLSWAGDDLSVRLASERVEADRRHAEERQQVEERRQEEARRPRAVELFHKGKC